jgi:iron complex transport system substrate-binding protein
LRVVSLLPSATEILFAIGAGDDVVGVTHECDFPPEARRRPVLTATALGAEMSASEVDSAVSAQLAQGMSLYTLDEAGVAALAPDLVVTQQLCPVCAVATEVVESAVRRLPRCPEVLSLDPVTVADVFADIIRLGAAIGRGAAAAALADSLASRLAAVRRSVAGRARPRVLALEWLDPPFGAGHWVPEMIAAAGGSDALGTAPGARSVRLGWEAVRAARAEVIVAMPCGYDEDGSRRQVALIAEHPVWRDLPAVRAGRVHGVDANGCFSRPGPRLIDGIERLAELFHPEAFGLREPKLGAASA